MLLNWTYAVLLKHTDYNCKRRHGNLRDGAFFICIDAYKPNASFTLSTESSFSHVNSSTDIVLSPLYFE